MHRGLQFLDHVAFLDQVVLDLDPGDFLECLGQCLGFVFMGGDGFRYHRDLLDTLGLELAGGIDEPLHLAELLRLAERGRLELLVNPQLGCGFIGPRQVGPECESGRDGHDGITQFHLISSLSSPNGSLRRGPGEVQATLPEMESALAHHPDQPGY